MHCLLGQAKVRQKRVKALVDCKSDRARELTFSKGEVIVVTREEDEQSWVSAAAVLASLPLPSTGASTPGFL